MKIKDDFKIRDMAGERIVVRQGRGAGDMTSIISLNASAEWLIESLRGRDFTIEDAARLLGERYEVDPDTALRDAGLWADRLAGCGLLEQ